MTVQFAVGLIVAFMLTSFPVSPQSACAECFKTVQEELKACRDNAISVDDKNTCEENREKGMNACEDRECTAERESQESTREQLEQKR